MQPEQIQAQIESQIPDSQVQVGVEGSHISVIVVSLAFEGLSSVKRQQTVYATLADRIADGSIHAVHMKTFTPQEWQQQQELFSGDRWCRAPILANTGPYR